VCSEPINHFVLANFWADIDQLNTGAMVEETSSPGTSVTIAKRWLEDCLGQHEKCKSLLIRNQHTQLPARLIEIGVPTPDKVRLWIRPKETHLAINPRYMTLSHCWGSARILTLRAETVDILMSGISVSHLPRTFREAIYLTKQMGANFLWIDSLCILQDSVGDWQQEASLMADVYRGRLCNIAANVFDKRVARACELRVPTRTEPYGPI
jgi:Heterokaryon incompatibility protein (HET)